MTPVLADLINQYRLAAQASREHAETCERRARRIENYAATGCWYLPEEIVLSTCKAAEISRRYRARKRQLSTASVS